MLAQILVVDDHAPSCELISEILRSAGFEVSSLSSSAEAAERLAKEKFHAVFLDMRMPPPDGLELARQVRGSRMNASTVIIMITGKQDRTLMKRIPRLGNRLHWLDTQNGLHDVRPPGSRSTLLGPGIWQSHVSTSQKRALERSPHAHSA